jgi:hypothetical protein
VVGEYGAHAAGELNAGVEMGDDGDAAVDDEERCGVGIEGAVMRAPRSRWRQLTWVSPLPSARGRKRAPLAPKDVSGSVAPWVKWMTSIASAHFVR